MKYRIKSKLSYLPLVLAGLMLCALLGMTGEKVPAAPAQSSRSTGNPLAGKYIVINPGHGRFRSILGDTTNLTPEVPPEAEAANWSTYPFEREIYYLEGGEVKYTTYNQKPCEECGDYELREDCLTRSLASTLYTYLEPLCDDTDHLASTRTLSTNAGYFENIYHECVLTDWLTGKTCLRWQIQHPWYEMDANEYLKHILLEKADRKGVIDTYNEYSHETYLCDPEQNNNYEPYRGFCNNKSELGWGFDGSWNDDINARPYYANRIGGSCIDEFGKTIYIPADVMVSLHVNGSKSNNKSHGTQIYYAGCRANPKNSEVWSTQSANLAVCYQQKLDFALIDIFPDWPIEVKQVTTRDVYGEISLFNGPTILIELGYIDRLPDFNYLNNELFRARAMMALKDALVEWFDNHKGPGTTCVTAVRGMPMEPAIAFNPHRLGQNYLIVWWKKDSSPTELPDGVYGRFVNPDGVPAGPEFQIAKEQIPGVTNSTERNAPRVTYNSETGRFLVTWQELNADQETGYSLFSRVVVYDGTLVGSPDDPISPIAENIAEGADWEYDIAYQPNSPGRSFLVIFRTGTALRKVFLQDEGRVMAGSLDDIYSYWVEDVHLIYDPNNKVFLTVFQSSNQDRSTINALVLEPDGTVKGSPLEIDNPAWKPAAIDLVYDSGNNKYLVIWIETDNPSNVIGRVLQYNGSDLYALGDSFQVEGDVTFPELVYSQHEGRLLMLAGDGTLGRLTGRYISLKDSSPSFGHPFVLAESWDQTDGAAHNSNTINPQHWMAVWHSGKSILARSISPSILDVHCPGLCMIGPEGGVYWSGTERTNFSINEGALASSVEVEILEDTSLIEQPAPGVPAGYQVSFRVPEWEAGGQTSGFLLPITIHVSYSDLDLLHLDPSQLTLFHWDAADSLWTLLPTTVDAASSRAMIQTTDTGIFSLQGSAICPGDFHEPDDNSYTASVISTDGTPLNMLFDNPSDEDWFRLEAFARGQYLFETTNLALDVDTLLEVIGPDGLTILAADDNSGGSGGSHLEWEAPSDDTFFLRIAQAPGSTNGCSASYTLSVTAELIIDTGPPQTVDEGSQVTFGGAFSSTGGCTPTITWDFGDDGTASDTLTPSHVYADDGIYTVTLSITCAGVPTSDTIRVTVLNTAPVVEAGADQSAYQDEELTFGGSFNDAGLLDSHVITWDFGDGSTANGELNPVHAFADSGVYTVMLTVTDDDGGIGEDTLTVTVDPPPTPAPAHTPLPPGDGTGLKGEYFNNLDVSGVAIVSRVDPQVDFNWGYDSPVPGVIADDFSARWTGQVQARSSEDYIFSVLADDGIRLWIDGQLVLDDWDSPIPDWISTTPLALTAGQLYDVRLELYDSNGAAEIVFSWRSISDDIPFDIIPMEQLYLPPGDLPPAATPTSTPEGGENLALGQPVMSGSECDEYQTAEMAVDGLLDTKWCAFYDENNPRWWRVDLGQVYSLHQFRIYHAEAGGEAEDLNTRDFTIEVSANGTDWTTVVEVYGNTDGFTSHDIAPIDARYVRLHVLAGVLWDEDIARINEFEVYGSLVPDPTPAPDPTDTPVPKGDVNNDGSIDIVDTLLVAQYYVGLNITLDEDTADVNCDGEVDIVDALLIAQYYVGLIAGFC